MTRRWPATYPSRTTRTVCAPLATSRTVSGVSPTSRPSSTTRAPAGVERMRSRPAAAGVAAAWRVGRRVPAFGVSDASVPGVAGVAAAAGSRTAPSVNSRTELPLVASAAGAGAAAAARVGFWLALPARHLVACREPKRYPHDKREPQRPHGGPRGGGRAVDVSKAHDPAAIGLDCPARFAILIVSSGRWLGSVRRRGRPRRHRRDQQRGSPEISVGRRSSRSDRSGAAERGLDRGRTAGTLSPRSAGRRNDIGRLHGFRQSAPAEGGAPARGRRLQDSRLGT